MKTSFTKIFNARKCLLAIKVIILCVATAILVAVLNQNRCAIKGQTASQIVLLGAIVYFATINIVHYGIIAFSSRIKTKTLRLKIGFFVVIFVSSASLVIGTYTIVDHSIFKPLPEIAVEFFPTYENILVGSIGLCCILFDMLFFFQPRETVYVDFCILFTILLFSVLASQLGAWVQEDSLCMFNVGALAFHLVLGTLLFDPFASKLFETDIQSDHKTVDSRSFDIKERSCISNS